MTRLAGSRASRSRHARKAGTLAIPTRDPPSPMQTPLNAVRLTPYRVISPSCCSGLAVIGENGAKRLSTGQRSLPMLMLIDPAVTAPLILAPTASVNKLKPSAKRFYIWLRCTTVLRGVTLRT